MSLEKLIDVYKSQSGEAYLYVRRTEGLVDIPAPLLDKFPVRKPVLSRVLGKQASLAGVDEKQFIQVLSEKGFYLQLVRDEDDEMRAMADKNAKLSK